MIGSFVPRGFGRDYRATRRRDQSPAQKGNGEPKGSPLHRVTFFRDALEPDFHTHVEATTQDVVEAGFRLATARARMGIRRRERGGAAAARADGQLVEEIVDAIAQS